MGKFVKIKRDARCQYAFSCLSGLIFLYYVWFHLLCNENQKTGEGRLHESITRVHLLLIQNEWSYYDDLKNGSVYTAQLLCLMFIASCSLNYLKS